MAAAIDVLSTAASAAASASYRTETDSRRRSRIARFIGLICSRLRLVRITNDYGSLSIFKSVANIARGEDLGTSLSVRKLFDEERLAPLGFGLRARGRR